MANSPTPNPDAPLIASVMRQDNQPHNSPVNPDTSDIRTLVFYWLDIRMFLVRVKKHPNECVL